ncbi:MAG: monofunctional biosynthetic peptidoglycan transglycosylase [Thermoanaerobaculia bacterium]|nr:monofunctional biosynthetic peptidoglycan transglycosylase [Thermoanaerobaculia bacterium]
MMAVPGDGDEFEATDRVGQPDHFNETERVDSSEVLEPVLEPAEKVPARRGWKQRPFRSGCLLLLGCFALFGSYQLLTWPRVAVLEHENPATTAFLERVRSRQSEGDPAVRDIRWVPYAQLSSHLKRAVLVSEDIDFFSHDGFATGEMKKAWEDFREGRELRGASTITQQLAKNLWLSPSRNPFRKVKEALLTVQLEHRLSKRRILEIYLNTVQFGPTIFGAENASRHYFGVSAANLSESQAAALAVALPSPRRWHPGSGSSYAAQRQQVILRRMSKAQWLWKEI